VIQVDWQALGEVIRHLPWLYILGALLVLVLLANLAGGLVRNLLPVLALLFVLYVVLRGLGVSPGEAFMRLDALFGGGP
jgi:hypothetical protein